MLVDQIQELRSRLDRAEYHSQALLQLSSHRRDWLALALKQDDWELLSELFCLELVALRSSPEATRSPEVAAESYLPYMDESLMAARIAAELELLDPSDLESVDTLLERGEMAWTTGRALEDGGQIKEALIEYLVGRAWLTSLPPGQDDPWMVGALDNCIGNAWRIWDRLDKSLAAFHRGLTVNWEEDPDTRGVLENNLGLTLRQLGQAEEAAEAFHRALEAWSNEADPSAERLSWLSAAEGNLGTAYSELGDPHRALARQRRNVQLTEQLYLKEPNAENLDALARGLGNLGNALRQQGLVEEGTECNRRARDLVREAPTGPYDLREHLATLEFSLGNGLTMGERHEEAIVCYRAAILLWRELISEGRPGLAFHLGLTQSNLAMALAGQGKKVEALDFLQVALSTLETAKPEGPHLYHLANAYGHLAHLHESEGRYDLAAAAAQQARELWIQAIPYYPAGVANLAFLERSLGGVQLQRRQYSSAVELLEQSLERFEHLIKEKGQLDLREDRAQATALLAEALTLTGRHFEAVEVYHRAYQLWNALDGKAEETESARNRWRQAEARASEF